MSKQKKSISTIKIKKPPVFDFDLICIGGGSAGCRVASLAARAGKKVALVESNLIGGDCSNFSCIPSKALLQATQAYQQVLRSKSYGVEFGRCRLNWAKVMSHKNQAIKRTGVFEGQDILNGLGVTVLRGRALFVTPWVINVSGRSWRSKKFLIATGSKDYIPTIDGLDQIDYLTYKEALNLSKPPSSLLIIGGGSTGCELAQFFSHFSKQVHLVEKESQLLKECDLEVGQIAGKLLHNQGVGVYLKTFVSKIGLNPGGRLYRVNLEKDGRQKQVTVEKIVVATGRTPNVDNLNLDHAGVKHDNQSGINVNRYLQTSNSNIYAAGDVTGEKALTHIALYQAGIVAHNLWTRRRLRTDYKATPQCIFLDPEIATVGMGEKELKATSSKYGRSISPIKINSRSSTSNNRTGFVKILTNHRGILVGGSIVGPRAGEMIHELALAINNNLSVLAINKTIHAFPTWSESILDVCHKIVEK